MNTQFRAPEQQTPAKPAPEHGRRKARKIAQHSDTQHHDTAQNPHKLGVPAHSNRIFQTKTNLSTPQSTPRSTGNTPTPDLRRRAFRGGREYAELLIDRAVWLPAADRELVTAVFAEGLSVAAYTRRCRERGFGDQSARINRRRLRRLITRLISPKYAFVIARRGDWPIARRRVAMACLVQGLPFRHAAAALGLSLHAVRRHIDAVEAAYLTHVEATHRAPSPTSAGCWR